VIFGWTFHREKVVFIIQPLDDPDGFRPHHSKPLEELNWVTLHRQWKAKEQLTYHGVKSFDKVYVQNPCAPAFEPRGLEERRNDVRPKIGAALPNASKLLSWKGFMIWARTTFIM
jgi:hypothetical protein